MDFGRQVAYYNEKWEAGTTANLLQMARCVAILRHIQFAEARPPRICDLGCGNGWLTNILASFGPALGVDLSDAAVEAASAKYPSAEFRCADIQNWNYPEEAFDVVVSQEVLEHVEDQPRYLSIANGLLRPGGRLILTTPNADTMLAMPEAERRAWSNQPIENWVARSQLRSMLCSLFKDVRVTSIISGYGSLGMYRLVNSYKVNLVAQKFGLSAAWRQAACALGFGLHLVGVGRKR